MTLTTEQDSLIPWLEWGDAAFAKARHENKPILLDISAVWCHWCHRLDKDTYAVPDIAEYVTANFVPVRVDTDKRPDINRRYNLGGWPTTAFLNPDGVLIGGGTYFPPEQMRQILRDIKSSWQKPQNPPVPQPPPEEPAKQGELSEDIVDEILGEVANNFDPIYGGFGSQPKFPQTEAQELALMRYYYTGNREILRIATVTMNNAGRSGTYDKEMGGFFRYSTTRDWSVPHFEKMCEDNAKWLQLYLHAYQITGDTFYSDIAKGIIGYVNEWLSDQQQGGFYGSQDADEEYYNRDKSNRLQMRAPYIDRNFYTNWNAMMATSYLDASFVLGDIALGDFALKSLERLLSLNSTPEGMYHFFDGEARLPNQLIDQMQIVSALTHAYELSGEKRFLIRATDLARLSAERFRDTASGGFFDTVPDVNAPGFLRQPFKALDENSLTARSLSRLYYLTHDAAYLKLAEESLRCFAGTYLSFGFMSADYALAVDAFLHEATVIRIVGSREKAGTMQLLGEAARTYDPRKVIQILDPDADAAEIQREGFSPRPTPTAYVCVGRTCTAPITEPKEIPAALRQMAAPQSRK